MQLTTEETRAILHLIWTVDTEAGGLELYVSEEDVKSLKRLVGVIQERGRRSQERLKGQFLKDDRPKKRKVPGKDHLGVPQVKDHTPGSNGKQWRSKGAI